MKGTIIDFLKLAAEKPELARELIELAGRYGFEFSDEVSDEDLDGVAGGVTTVFANMLSMATKGDGTAVTTGDLCETPGDSTALPTPYPSADKSSESEGTKQTKDDGEDIAPLYPYPKG